MDAAPTLPFAALLRRYRLAAGLSQEELAERARLSVQAVSALERGIRRAPYRDTVDLLAGALGLTGEQREQFRTAVSRRRGPAVPSARPDLSRGNLPSQTTSFIGREHEQATVLRLLESSRLLTLTGTGGVGKTRLATHVAAALLDRYPDGVWLVELAALPDPALVPQAAARALGVKEEPGRPLPDVLADALRDKRFLLILDNCEHLREAAGELAETLLRAGPGPRILATSREALGMVGETVWWVPSLTVPETPTPVGGPPRHTAQSVLRAESVQLFCDRAAAAHAAFGLTDANAAAVAAICRRLDGIPLAIELAAARARILAPEQIAARLDARFRLLTRGREDALPRQQTLRATLDWSYDLLTEPERRLLARLSVFAGGCAIEAAEAVCAGGGIEPDALLDLLHDLADKSLLVVEYRGDGARYHLLETVREYAAEKLEGMDEGMALRRRQRDWCLSLVSRVGINQIGAGQSAALERLELEHDNFRAALGWSSDGGEATAALRLATALCPFWEVRGHLREGQGWLAQALACADDALPELRAAALGAAASLAYRAGDPEAMREYAEAKLAICRELEDRNGMAGAFIQIGGAAWERREIDEARAHWEESLRLMRDLGDQPGIAQVLANLGNLAQFADNHPRAAELYEQSLTISRSIGHKRYTLLNLRQLGITLLDLGDRRRAGVRGGEPRGV